jgi:hypothetical protein
MSKPKQTKHKSIWGSTLSSKNRRVSLFAFKLNDGDLVFCLKTKRLIDFKSKEIAKHEILLTKETLNLMGQFFHNLDKDPGFIALMKEEPTND